MEIKLTDSQLRDIVVEALFEKLDEKTRKELISGALHQLLEKDPNYNGTYHRRSRLQVATDEALAKIAEAVIVEELGKSEIRERIRELVTEALERVMSVDREKAVQRLADGMSLALVRGAPD